MASITDFGGAFMRAKDPEALDVWYERHFGLVRPTDRSRFPPRLSALRLCSPSSDKRMRTFLLHRRRSSIFMSTISTACWTV
jgi:hypothetical protein